VLECTTLTTMSFAAWTSPSHLSSSAQAETSLKGPLSLPTGSSYLAHAMPTAWACSTPQMTPVAEHGLNPRACQRARFAALMVAGSLHGRPVDCVDISSTVGGDKKFNGAAVSMSGVVVFAPHNADCVGTFDATNVFRCVVDVSLHPLVTSANRFRGIAASMSSDIVVFAPRHSQCILAVVRTRDELREMRDRTLRVRDACVYACVYA
jgi:hypothetical protein